jgi:hypothetical protein
MRGLKKSCVLSHETASCDAFGWSVILFMGASNTQAIRKLGSITLTRFLASPSGSLITAEDWCEVGHSFTGVTLGEAWLGVVAIVIHGHI